MWLGEVVTLAVGTLIVLVLIHLTIFWVTRTLSAPPAQPTIVYVPQPAAAPPPPPPAPEIQLPVYGQGPSNTQTADVPALDPKNALPPAISGRTGRPANE